MKIKPFKLKKRQSEFKPLIFIGYPRLKSPKIPLRIFFNIDKKIFSNSKSTIVH